MTGELKQEDLEQGQKLCEEAGIVPVINPANEDLRMKELKRLGMLEKDLEKDRRYSSLTEVVTYLTGCRMFECISLQNCATYFLYNTK